MHLIQNESRYSIEFRKAISIEYYILINIYFTYIDNTCIPKHFHVLVIRLFLMKNIRNKIRTRFEMFQDQSICICGL